MFQGSKGTMYQGRGDLGAEFRLSGREAGTGTEMIMERVIAEGRVLRQGAGYPTRASEQRVDSPDGTEFCVEFTASIDVQGPCMIFFLPSVR